MSANEKTRCTLTVSRDIDMAVRSLLSRSGRDTGDPSELVREAARWRIFDQTLEESSAQFADLTPDASQDLIDEATDAVRDETRDPLSKPSGAVF